MSLHLITGYAGKEHITSADQGSFNIAIMGNVERVMDRGSKFSAQIISNNKVRVNDGDLIMQGRHFRQKENTYTELNFENGTQSLKRNDLIVVRYEKDSSSGVESASFRVIKGASTDRTPVDPSYITGDITEHGGALVNEMPLYRVPFDGLTIQPIEKMFKEIPSIAGQFDVTNKKCQALLDDMSERMDAVLAELLGVTVTFRDENIGDVINVTGDGQEFTKTVDGSLKLLFALTSVGTWTFKNTTKNETVEKYFQYYGEYEFDMYSTLLGFKTWIESAGYTTAQYADENALFADEKAVRKLMTLHASADVLADWLAVDSEAVAKFTANRVAMKWIGLRKYIYDKLMAIPALETALQTSAYSSYVASAPEDNVSEFEFGDSTIEMIYDNGVELQSLSNGYYLNTGGTVITNDYITKGNDYVTIKRHGTTGVGILCGIYKDITPYKNAYMRFIEKEAYAQVIFGGYKKLSNTADSDILLQIQKIDGQTEVIANYYASGNMEIDLTNINQTALVSAMNYNCNTSQSGKTFKMVRLYLKK